MEAPTYLPGDILRETERLVRDRLGDAIETITVERVVIGLFFTGVKLSDGSGYHFFEKGAERLVISLPKP